MLAKSNHINTYIKILFTSRGVKVQQNLTRTDKNKEEENKRPLNIIARLQSAQATSDILSRNCYRMIQLITTEIKVGTNLSRMLQHLIPVTTHDFHSPLKILLRPPPCNNHLFFKAFQSIDMVILILLKNFSIFFEHLARLGKKPSSSVPLPKQNKPSTLFPEQPKQTDVYTDLTLPIKS